MYSNARLTGDLLHLSIKSRNPKHQKRLSGNGDSIPVEIFSEYELGKHDIQNILRYIFNINTYKTYREMK